MGTLLRFIVLALTLLASPAWAEMPAGFVKLNEYLPSATYDVRYYGEHNFVGERITGYNAPVVILSLPAARNLGKVQEDLKPFGLGLKIFDGYRPQRAVNHFVRWANNINDTKTKLEFYPDVEKQHLFRDGYIAAKSGHSRGSTVDVTIIDLESSKELDMGTPFDFFGLESWPDNHSMAQQIRTNRALLQNVMMRNGFKPYEAEWWHFTLEDEPYPETYFDFVVE